MGAGQPEKLKTMVLTKRWIYLKAGLFGLIALLTVTLLLLRLRDAEGAVLLALAIWSTARLYYFAFYVIEKYVDPTFKFAGLLDAARYFLREKRR